jgi:hypothetical protein
MRENSILKKRIMQVLDFKGIKRNRFYLETGISNGILSQSNGLSEDNLLRFLNFYPDVNPEWLITGSGTMLKTKSEENLTLLNSKEKGKENGKEQNVQKTLPFEKDIAEVGLVAEERSEYRKPQADAARIQELQELLREQKELYLGQKELYMGQIQFLTAQIEVLTKDKEERIQEYRDRIEELKEQISVLKNVSPLDDTQRGVG